MMKSALGNAGKFVGYAPTRKSMWARLLTAIWRV